MNAQHTSKQTKTKKRPGVKNFLSSPYSLTGPKLDKGDNKNILDGIISVFPPGGIKREEAKDVSQEGGQFVSWEMAKNSLVFGVNSVTKSLEKDDVMLVLVCGSTKPVILTNHLMLLSATRSTPCCAVFGLSEVMAPLLGLKTVAACGFKRNITADILKDLVEYIVCKVPPLPEQHLETWKNNGHTTSHISREIRENKMQGGNDTNVLNLPSQTKLIKEQKYTSLMQGKKRKLDAIYVNTKIKTLSPREMPKIKKKKKFLKKAVKHQSL